MVVKLDKPQALCFFCLARQAERSIDFALSSERQWELLRQYYENARLVMLESAVESLHALIPAWVPAISSGRAFRFSLGEILSYPVRLILNRRRASWYFQQTELRFILETFQSAISLLKRRQKPESSALVQTRMDLYACEVIIERKLAGLPEVRQAQRIEHFCQASHLEPFKLEQVFRRETEPARRVSA